MNTIITGGRRAGFATMMAAAAIAMMDAGTPGNGSAVANARQATPSGISTAQTPGTPAKAPRGTGILSAILSGWGGGSRSRERARGPGWTNAHAKRVARKARAVKAHRARGKE